MKAVKLITAYYLKCRCIVVFALQDCVELLFACCVDPASPASEENELDASCLSHSSASLLTHRPDWFYIRF